MSKAKLNAGTAHNLPDDLSEALRAANVTEQWRDITPLARNEFICWVSKTPNKTKPAPDALNEHVKS